MRYLVAIFSCLMFLTFAGPAGAASVPMGCADSPAAMEMGSMDDAGCGMCPDKGHKCDHDACCGYQVVALSGVVNPVTPVTACSSNEAAIVKHLTSSGPDTLLDPPRA